MTGRPLLFCDVDGVLSLWGFDPASPPPGRWAQVDGTTHFLSTGGGDLLRGLSGLFDVVWCTGWEERADENLPPLLGLPAGLPHLVFDGRSRAEVSAHGHWKLPAIDAYAGTRPAAWIDDALDSACRRWADARKAPTLLVGTDPATGLDARCDEELRRFAAGHRT
ncbi:MAG: hypothetical protein V9E83_02920 [Baekduia sp.]